eukprot:CAMPEP_0184014260 /NCGR_PEP_ID=MMETSP0954-20121128/5527_1 /TAXON_ID=627963 /ORGANISM="Aplanochytrium sp, Strain PBS07" /LENGTH=79 /DNA_ID=CAMNT_0026294655 /DNA_START=737 /DNA_END=972 /DNA_ORIENTATION=-
MKDEVEVTEGERKTGEKIAVVQIQKVLHPAAETRRTGPVANLSKIEVEQAKMMVVELRGVQSEEPRSLAPSMKDETKKK